MFLLRVGKPVIFFTKNKTMIINIVQYLSEFQDFKSGVVRQLIISGKVMINNKIVNDTNRWVQTGDSIVVLHDTPDKTKVYVV